MTATDSARSDASAAPVREPPAGGAAVPKITLGMQSISDVVFGLALSIGAVILISKLPPTPTELGVDILAFGFNFLIVVLVWIGYRRAAVTLPYETQATVVVNLALLFAVSVEPFLFWVMVAGNNLLEPASMGYGLAVGSMILLQAALNYLLLREEKASPRPGFPPIALERIRNRMWSGAAIGLIFLASALPIFWIPAPPNTTLRIDFWYAGLALIFVLPRLAARGRRRAGGPQDPPATAR